MTRAATPTAAAPGFARRIDIARKSYLAISLGLILAVAVALRFWDLGRPSFWVDELYSMNFAKLPQQWLWSDWMVVETNPPLFYSLLSGWTALLGDGEFAARALSAVFGVLAVGVVFLLARALFSANVALLAAALTTLSSQQLEFSQQVRGYTLGMLAAAAALLALVRLTDRWIASAPATRHPWPDLVLYTGAATAAFYTHTTFFLLPVLANLYMVWLWGFRTPRRRDAALGWIVANLVLALLCAWWVWITYLQMQTGSDMISWIEKPDLRMGVLKLAHVVAPRVFEPVKLVLAVLFGGLFLWGAWRLALERRVLAFVFGAGIPLLLFAISQRQPIYMERTLYWAQAVYFPCIAAGILALPVARLRAPAAAAACLLFLADAVVWRQTEYREPWREIAAVIGERAGPNDAVLTYSRDAAVNLDYYCDETRCGELASLALSGPGERTVFAGVFKGMKVDAANIAPAIARFDRIWVVSRGLDDDPRDYISQAAVLENAMLLKSAAVTGPSDRPINEMQLSLWRPDATR